LIKKSKENTEDQVTQYMDKLGLIVKKKKKDVTLNFPYMKFNNKLTFLKIRIFFLKKIIIIYYFKYIRNVSNIFSQEKKRDNLLLIRFLSHNK
jgi:hypothetical protein